VVISPCHALRIPTMPYPFAIPLRTTARIAALRPGQAPAGQYAYFS